MVAETKVPAELIAEIKQGLISLGYATEETTDEFIQDAYFKYVIVRQTGFNPNMPYAIGLLPKELQDNLGGVGGGDEGEDGEGGEEPPVGGGGIVV